MADSIGLRRLRRILFIQRMVQIVLLGLLLYMALHFQQMFEATGNLKPFYNSLIATLLIQVALFFPIRKYTVKEAERELGAALKENFTAEEKQRLRNQRLLSDFIKASVLVFFAVFIGTAPPAGFVLSTTYFCCIGTILSYLQNYNYAVRQALPK